MMQQQMMGPQQMMPPQMMDPYAGTCMASDMPMQMPMGYQGGGYSQQGGGYPQQGGYNTMCSDPLLSPCLPSPTPPGVGQAAYSPPPDVPGNYQEIGAQMGPNALTIRVHKDTCKVEQVDNTNTNANPDGDGNCSCTIENFGKPKPKQNR